MRSRPLHLKAGIVATEYVLLAVAVLIALAFLEGANQTDCVAFEQGDALACESTLHQLGEALTERLSTTSFLLQMPF